MKDKYVFWKNNMVSGDKQIKKSILKHYTFGWHDGHNKRWQLTVSESELNKYFFNCCLNSSLFLIIVKSYASKLDHSLGKLQYGKRSTKLVLAKGINRFSSLRKRTWSTPHLLSIFVDHSPVKEAGRRPWTYCCMKINFEFLNKSLSGKIF